VHGEYKVPGGKLVVVDLDVRDDVLRDVRVAGDFFLEPDEAILAVDRALEGAPASTDAAGLAARISAALPESTVMLGLTAEGIGIAVRRALARATEWGDYDWQLIHTGPQAPALHMALDEVITAEVAAGRRPPTLRVWEWASPAVVIGSFQSLRNEVDPQGAARHGITVVRRISGGGAMFVEPMSTITYSLSVPEALVSGLSFADSYAYLDDWVLGALGDMGIKAWYQPLNDIATEAGKIAGAAVTSVGGAVVKEDLQGRVGGTGRGLWKRTPAPGGRTTAARSAATESVVDAPGRGREEREAQQGSGCGHGHVDEYTERVACMGHPSRHVGAAVRPTAGS
jgi:lipoate-protein ligase A